MLLSEYSIVTKLRLVDIDLLPPSSPLPNFTNNGDICHTSNIDTPVVTTIYHRDSISPIPPEER